MARYLVTGGAGFIGSHLCDELIKENEVYVLDNLYSGFVENMPKGVHFINGDVRDYSLVKELMSKVDGCFHLAAIVSIPQCNEDFLNSHSVNLTGTLNILESAHALSTNTRQIPIIFASSCAIYGDNQHLPIQESEEPKPISFYAELKLAGEQYAHFATEVNHLSVTALRLFNVYGSRQQLDNPYSGVIAIFLNNLMHDLPCIFYGDGSQSRDFIYVHDVVRFFIQAMNTATNNLRVFNACTGTSTDIKTIAELLGKATKKELKINLLPHKVGDIYHSLGNPLLASNVLGIRANTSIESGLRDLVNINLEAKK